MIGDDRLTSAQRAAAIDRVAESILVRSGAGAGKTAVLARRFTELLLSNGGGEDPLPRFVALTFTDKAAAEMVQRIRDMLSKAAAEFPAGSPQRRRISDWLARLPQARISTIHSFCSSLLRAGALEIGLDPNFSVCPDQLLIDALRAEAAEAALLAAVESERKPTLDLLSRRRFDRVLLLLEKLLTIRVDAHLSGHTDPAALLARWSEMLDRTRGQQWALLSGRADLRTLLDELASIHCNKPDDRLCASRDELCRLASEIINDPAARTADNFAALKAVSAAGGSAKAWAADLARIRSLMKLIAGQLAPYAVFAAQLNEIDELAASELAELATLALQANDLFAAAKRRRGILDFDDLMAHARALLATRPALAATLREGLDQLLIDEAQDTSSFQLGLLLMLLFESGSFEDDPAARKLFVVGDPTQSIYRFRGAAVADFRRLCDRLGAARTEHLDTSFRTHEAGVAFVNHLFGRLIADYEPIKAHRSQNPASPSVEIILATGADGQPFAGYAARAVSDAQAAAVAQRIDELLTSGEPTVWDRDAGQYRTAQPRDIAILLSRRTNSAAYERCLANRGIGYYVVAGLGFFHQQEVYDLLTALRAIDNDRDDLAFFGVLRSSLVGLSDDALLAIADAVARPYCASIADALNIEHSTLSLALSDADRASLAFAVSLLDRLRAVKDAIGIAPLIRELLAATGYQASLSAQPHARRALANVARLTDLARAADEAQLPLPTFLAQMDQRVADEARYEQAPLAGQADQVVRIMTVHAAKGLEFPIVILPDLNSASRQRSVDIINRLDFQLTYRARLVPDLDPDPDRDESAEPSADMPTSFVVARELERIDEQAEEIRRLYVAATRHQDRLIFVAGHWTTNDGVLREKNSPLGLLDCHLGLGAAIDAGAETIPYADGRYQISLRRLTPSQTFRSAGRTPGQQMLASASSPADIAAALSEPGATAAVVMPPLLAPIADSAITFDVSASSLGDFAACPALYYWRYVLRVPQELLPWGGVASGGAEIFTDPDSREHIERMLVSTGGTAADTAAVAPDLPIAMPPLVAPALAGTLFHRCLELLDFDAAEPASAAGSLLAAAAAEICVDDALPVDAVAALSTELADMLARFAATDLYARISRAASRRCELPFTMQAGPARVSGKIDLLIEDAAGLCVIDFKSDRVEAAVVADHSAHHRPQMLLYSAAVERHTRRVPEAMLYYLRPAVGYSVMVADADDGIRSLRSRLAGSSGNSGRGCSSATPDSQATAPGTSLELQPELEALLSCLARCHATGIFPPAVACRACNTCPYRPLCPSHVGCAGSDRRCSRSGPAHGTAS